MPTRVKKPVKRQFNEHDYHLYLILADMIYDIEINNIEHGTAIPATIKRINEFEQSFEHYIDAKTGFDPLVRVEDPDDVPF